tara:strand:- start:2156 stop:2914 length:759 start_codon:yes stop_codon:yes gene_type:complete
MPTSTKRTRTEGVEEVFAEPALPPSSTKKSRSKSTEAPKTMSKTCADRADHDDPTQSMVGDACCEEGPNGMLTSPKGKISPSDSNPNFPQTHQQLDNAKDVDGPGKPQEDAPNAIEISKKESLISVVDSPEVDNKRAIDEDKCCDEECAKEQNTDATTTEKKKGGSVKRAPKKAKKTGNGPQDTENSSNGPIRKRPHNAYLAYYRQELQKEIYAGVPVPERAKKIGALWREMNDEERKPYAAPVVDSGAEGV